MIFVTIRISKIMRYQYYILYDIKYHSMNNYEHNEQFILGQKFIASYIKYYIYDSFNTMDGRNSQIGPPKKQPADQVNCS